MLPKRLFVVVVGALCALFIGVSDSVASPTTTAIRQAYRASNRWIPVIRTATRTHDLAKQRWLMAQAKSNPAIGVAIMRTSHSESGMSATRMEKTYSAAGGTFGQVVLAPTTLTYATSYAGCWSATWYDREYNSFGDTLGSVYVALSKFCEGPGYTAIITGSIQPYPGTDDNSVDPPYCFSDIHDGSTWEGHDGQYEGSGNWQAYRQLSEADWGYGIKGVCSTSTKLNAIQRLWYYGYRDHVNDWGFMP